MKVYKDRFLSLDALSQELPTRDTEDNSHPTPEHLLIRKAAERLTKRQREVWELWNYDRLTQQEIAGKLSCTQSNVSNTLKAIEKRIIKWVKDHWAVYELLKKDYENGGLGD